MFCGTERFRCHVRQNLARVDELPASFLLDDCRPSESTVVDVETTLRTATQSENRISISPSDYADEYQLLVSQTPNDPNPTFVTSTRETAFSGIALEPCRPHYLRVVAVVAGVGPEYEFFPLNDRGCLPQTPHITHVEYLHGPIRPAATIVNQFGGSPTNIDSIFDSNLHTFRVHYSTSMDANAYRILHSRLPQDNDPGVTIWSPEPTLTVRLSLCEKHYLQVAAKNDLGEVVSDTVPFFADKRITRRFGNGMIAFTSRCLSAQAIPRNSLQSTQ